MLCYFIVSLDTILAGGSRHPREIDEFDTVFFVFERDVNERASSDMGEAGFNEMRVQRDRVQFNGGGTMIRQSSTTFILSFVAIGRGIVSLMRVGFLYCN